MGLPSQAEDQQRFLDSEPQWSSRIGEGWKGTKFLGMGCFGVTGLWEYQGAPGKPRPAIDKVVVKMAQMFSDLAEPGRLATDEGEIGRTIAGFNSKHLIRQYGGNKVGDNFSEMDQVVKTFLEYCPGGTVHDLLPGPKNLNPKPIHELDLWQIFKCLAEGVFAMDRQSANPKARRKVARAGELMHCDIKGDNIFFGSRDQDHPRLPICKFADFGEAVFVDSRELQDNAYGIKHLNRGAATYKPPEESYNKPFGGWQASGHYIREPRKGTCSNIWQIGALMNSLIIRESIDFNPEDVKGQKPPLINISYIKTPDSNANTRLRTFFNHSQKLESKEITDLYSATLLNLVKECLFREANERPDCLDLVKITTNNLDKHRKTFEGRTNITPPPVPSPWNDMPPGSSGGGGSSPEPPTLWEVAHVQDVNGGHYYDASQTKSVLSAAIDILPSVPGFLRFGSQTPPTDAPPSSKSSSGGLWGRAKFLVGDMANVGTGKVANAVGIKSKSSSKERKKRRRSLREVEEVRRKRRETAKGKEIPDSESDNWSTGSTSENEVWEEVAQVARNSEDEGEDGVVVNMEDL